MGMDKDPFFPPFYKEDILFFGGGGGGGALSGCFPEEQ